MMLLERDPEIDWKAILLDFVRAGWRLKAVSDAINVPDSTLRAWWNYGVEPRFEDGRALLKLHEKCFGNEAKVAPALQPAR